MAALAYLANELASDLLAANERGMVGAAFNELARGPFGAREGQAMALRVVNEARQLIVFRLLDQVASGVMQEVYAAPLTRGG